MRRNHVKERLEAGDTSFGTMVFEFGTTGIARLAAEAGAQFLLFDQEHSAWGGDVIRMLIATTRATEAIPMVRVPTAQYHLIAPILDLGAMGIMVPMVESAEQAALVARSCRYPPVGRRGAAFGIAHDDYAGGDIVEKMESANREVLAIAQIETAAGVEAVDAIAATPGIDVLWIGHFDLTNSLGIPGQFQHPDYLKSVGRVIQACRNHGKVAGFMASTPADAETALERGFRILAYGGDLWLYQTALRQGLAEIGTTTRAWRA